MFKFLAFFLVKFVFAMNPEKIRGSIFVNVLTSPIEIELFYKDCPLTVQNFISLSTGEFKPSLTYSNTIFHRLIKDFVIQGGDILNGNGTGSISIYNGKFKDESFVHKHKLGSISMANSGPNTNGSQFFICLSDLPYLDNKHVVVGRVLNLEILQEINEIKTDANDKPLKNIFIEKIEILQEQNEKAL